MKIYDIAYKRNMKINKTKYESLKSAPPYYQEHWNRGPWHLTKQKVFHSYIKLKYGDFSRKFVYGIKSFSVKTDSKDQIEELQMIIRNYGETEPLISRECYKIEQEESFQGKYKMSYKEFYEDMVASDIFCRG